MILSFQLLYQLIGNRYHLSLDNFSLWIEGSVLLWFCSDLTAQFWKVMFLSSVLPLGKSSPGSLIITVAYKFQAAICHSSTFHFKMYP